jgi:hypothetical protein
MGIDRRKPEDSLTAKSQELCTNSSQDTSLMRALLTFMRRQMRRAFLPLLALLVVVTGCQPVSNDSSGSPKAGAPAVAAQPESGIVSAMTDSVNYMRERAVQYTLYDLSQTPPRAIGGAIVSMLASGGEKGCCIALPTKWKPGMKVRVQWDESDYDHIYPEKYSRELEIPRYAEPGDLYVVFYPRHEVEVVVSAADPGHPEWPGKIKQTPWEHCVATAGEKSCKAVLPKLFDTGSRGLCSYMKEFNLPNNENLCLSAMQDCMRDYEDEAFCKEILWAPACEGNNKDDPYCMEKAQEKKTK